MARRIAIFTIGIFLCIESSNAVQLNGRLVEEFIQCRCAQQYPDGDREVDACKDGAHFVGAYLYQYATCSALLADTFRRCEQAWGVPCKEDENLEEACNFPAKSLNWYCQDDGGY